MDEHDIELSVEVMQAEMVELLQWLDVRYACRRRCGNTPPK